MLTAYRFHEAPVVTLFVGMSQKPFYVHVDLLCETSSFFKAAFTGDFKESADKTMQLPEDNEKIFSLLIDCLYQQRYEMPPESDDDDEDSDDDSDGIDDGKHENNRFYQVFRLFVLAEKYGVPSLKWLLIKALFAQAGIDGEHGPTNASIGYLYEHTTQSSGIRKLVADWHTWGIDLGWYENSETPAFLQQQPEFSTDLNLRFAKTLKQRQILSYNPFEGDIPEEYGDKEPEQEK